MRIIATIDRAVKYDGTKYKEKHKGLIVPDGMFVHLSGLGSFHKDGKDPLAEFVPERKTYMFALHPDKWEETFYSLTNKESKKIMYYKPTAVENKNGILVGDMAIANRFYRTDDESEKKKFAKAYKVSLKPLVNADLSRYKMPELLVPN